MDDKKGYAVFFFPPALDALGDAIKPYLVEGMGGPHLLCREIDTGGALIEMTLDGLDDQGAAVELEIMVPSNMVRMIVSVRGDEAFGFGPRLSAATERVAAAPAAPPVDAHPESLPATANVAEAKPGEEPRRP